jgi:hypothetical protein
VHFNAHLTLLRHCEPQQKVLWVFMQLGSAASARQSPRAALE